MISLEKIGSRLYFVGDTYAAKDRIKRIGGHWDGDRRQWWVGVAKKADAEQLIADLSRPVMAATEGSAIVSASVGLAPETPAGIVADKLEEEGRVEDAAKIRAGGRTQRDPDEVRLHGKGTWQGRVYYLGATTKDGTRALILQLPAADGTYFERWVPTSEVTVTKTYTPTERWNGRYGRHSGNSLQYQTLGGIARFLAKQKDPQTRRVQCVECGSWHDADGVCHCGGC